MGDVEVTPAGDGQLPEIPGHQIDLIEAMRAAKAFPPAGEVAEHVAGYKQRRPKASPEQLSRAYIKMTTAKLTGTGAATALPAVVPGAGTAVQIGFLGLIPAESWYIMRQLTKMQLTVAAFYGHDPDHLDRHDELLVVWALVTRAVVPATEATKRVGTKIAISQFNRRVSGKVLAQINRRLGTTVLTKWGTKRGGIALGRMIPLGVSALVGGGFNYFTAKGFGSQVLRYYSKLGPEDHEVIVLH